MAESSEAPSMSWMDQITCTLRGNCAELRQKVEEERAKYNRPKEEWQKLARENDLFTLGDFKYYQHQPWAKEIVMLTGEEEPYIPLEGYEHFKTVPFYREVIDAMVQRLMQRDAWRLLEYHLLIKDRSYYSEALKKALPSALENQPDVLLAHIDLYRDHPHYSQLLKEVVEHCLQDEPGANIQYYYQYQQEPYFEEMLEYSVRAAVEEDPFAALQSFDCYKNQPYAEDMLEMATRNVARYRPRLIMMEADVFLDKPYATEIFQIIAVESPWALLKQLGKKAFWGFRLPDIRKKVPKIDTIIAEAMQLIEVADHGLKIPEALIRAEDFPLDTELFKKYLLSINYHGDRVLWEQTKEDSASLTKSDFEAVFFSDAFQAFLYSQIGKITYMNAFSIAKAVYRGLIRNGLPLNETNVKKIIQIIEEEREYIKDEELFGPDTQLIVFSHEEDRFNNQTIEDLFRVSGGQPHQVLASEKGVKMETGKNQVKERTLSTIASCRGRTTVVFEGHSSPENLAFAGNQPEHLYHSLAITPFTINYIELGDALIASQNLNNINLIIMGCFSYDFVMNLSGYLGSKGIAERPRVTIAMNDKGKRADDKGNFLTVPFLYQIYEEDRQGQPLTVDYLFKVENLLWKAEHDPVIFGGARKQPPSAKKSPQYFELGQIEGEPEQRAA